MPETYEPTIPDYKACNLAEQKSSNRYQTSHTNRNSQTSHFPEDERWGPQASGLRTQASPFRFVLELEHGHWLGKGREVMYLGSNVTFFDK